MWFYDERNRAAAAQVFQNNGFKTSFTETHDKRAKFWLLASRSAMIERLPEELKRVCGFAESYGGHYDQCNPQL